VSAPSPGAVRSLRGLPLEPPPGAVRISGSGACRAEGLGSNEETGVGRGHAGLDRPRLRADGTRVGPPRRGRTPGAWSLVPDGNRGVPSPASAAAVCAGAACGGTGAGAGLVQTVVPAEFGSGPGNWPARKSPAPGNPGRTDAVVTWQNQDHQLAAPGLGHRTSVHSPPATVRYVPRSRTGTPDVSRPVKDGQL